MTAATYRFSDRTAEMDRDAIHAWLSEQSYWALGRARSVQDAAIDASLNFGMFETGSGRQVAFARVVTDSATFAWLCDVFVDPAVRGEKVGVALIEGVCASLDARGLPRVFLATGDAHGLYAKFGFEALPVPGKWMQRITAEPAA